MFEFKIQPMKMLKMQDHPLSALDRFLSNEKVKLQKEYGLSVGLYYRGLPRFLWPKKEGKKTQKGLKMGKFHGINS